MQQIGLFCIGVSLACLAQARDLTVVNFGGANGNAQKAAFVQPFEKATGHRITSVEYNGEQAKVKAMVEARKVSWDVVDIETSDVTRGCEEGLYEKIDWSQISAKPDLMPGAVQECGVGIFVWSTVLGYDANRLKAPPTGWKDFWNLKKYPGKRGLRKTAIYNLEFALMADGVAVNDVYQVLSTKDGVDRAFRKLDEIKPHIQWWEAGAQSTQFLVAGDVVMSTSFSGRIDAAQREGKPLQLVWSGSIYEMDYWAIPKGSPNKDLAHKYIDSTVSTTAQLAYAHQISYGPVNMRASKQLDEKTLAKMPVAPANAAQALKMNGEFWTEHAEELQQRFTAWAAR